MQPLLQWKSNNYYIFGVCVCSLRYPAFNAHASYFFMWPAQFYSIYDERPHPHVEKIAASSESKQQNYYNFYKFLQFTNLATGRILQPGRPWVGDP